MSESDWLAQRFQENRGHLRAVAYRMLGSSSEADDAVQEAWLRLNRSGAADIDNLVGWLTTVVARVCLDMLRARERREALLGARVPEPQTTGNAPTNPEQEALLANSVGIALLVVLERLTPAERLAFVLHDIFAVSFEEIAAIVGRTPTAARQLASRARRRVQGTGAHHNSNLAEQREVVDAFLDALRRGDFEGLLAVLDPDVVVRVDQSGTYNEIRGARNWAKDAVTRSRIARFAQSALVDGVIGAVFAPRGRLFSVLRFAIAGAKIVHVEVIVNPARFRELDLAVLKD